MLRFWLIVTVISAQFPLFSQNVSNPNPVSSQNLDRPKLVVGLMIDQMRWDFFYRYYDRYKQGGFKRILREGFTCENALIPYAQTVTAAGHASVYTGSVPTINGIMGNEWYDRSRGDYVYCVDDANVKTIGGGENAEPMSPRNLFTTTIGDELRLATNFRSKVVGVAIKDRGSILPAGHSGDAYWYDSRTGNFVTSTYYKDKLPSWVTGFNNRKLTDSLYNLDWNTLYPIETYVQSDKDNVAYEGRFMHEESPTFPHKLTSLVGVNFGSISSTPYGNTLTLSFAKAALLSESLGKDAIPDMLAVSLSSPDYTGHQFGPNSIEIEDMYLRLDAELEAFFNFLDAEVGKGQWLFFLTADHAVAHTPGFLKKNKIPAGTLATNVKVISDRVMEKFRVPNIIEASANYHLYLNNRTIDSAKADKAAIEKFIIDELLKDTAVSMAFPSRDIMTAAIPNEMKQKFLNGMNQKLGGDIILILKPGYFFGARTGTTHGSWYPYDSHIPMAFMGWGIKPGKTGRTTYMTDIAPTIATLLHIQQPSGSIGQPVFEITNQQ